MTTVLTHKPQIKTLGVWDMHLSKAWEEETPGSTLQVDDDNCFPNS